MKLHHMIKIASVLLLLVAFYVVAFKEREGGKEVSHETKLATLSGEWHIYRGDRELTGYSANKLGRRFQLRWSAQIAQGNKSSAIVADGNVYIGGADGSLYSLDLATGEKKWELALGSSIEASPFFDSGVVFVGDTDGVMHAVDAANRKEKWSFKTGAQITGSVNMTTLPDGQKIVVFGSHDAKVYALDQGSGELIWKHQTESYVNGTVAVDGDKIVVTGCDHFLRVLDALSGKELFSADVGSYIAGSAALKGGVAYAGHYGNQVVAVDLGRKKMIWTFGDEEKGRPYFSSPAVTDDVVVIGSRDENIYCLDRSSGKKRWHYRSNGHVDSSVVICRDKVIAGGMDGRIMVLDLVDGKLLYQYDAGSPVSASPGVIDNGFLVCPEDGRLMLFESVAE